MSKYGVISGPYLDTFYAVIYFHIKVLLKLQVKSLLQFVFWLITWNKKSANKTTCRMSSANLRCNHISWRAFLLLWLLFEISLVSWFVRESIFDQFQILLTWFFNRFRQDQCKQNNLIRFVSIQRYYIMVIILIL